MVDHITPERRSWLMSRVKGKDTTPEMRVRRLAHAMGLRFRLHRKDLPGKPDLVFSRFNAAVFVHGCFWHRHADCPKASNPKSRVDFWNDKFRRNIERDLRVQNELKTLGWKPIIIWECETKSHDQLLVRIQEIIIRGSDGKGKNREARS